MAIPRQSHDSHMVAIDQQQPCHRCLETNKKSNTSSTKKHPLGALASLISKTTLPFHCSNLIAALHSPTVAKTSPQCVAMSQAGCEAKQNAPSSLLLLHDHLLREAASGTKMSQKDHTAMKFLLRGYGRIRMLLDTIRQPGQNCKHP